MTTPCSGTISLDSVRTELGLSGQVSLNDTNIRSLAQKPSGTVDLQDLHCKNRPYWFNAEVPFATGYNTNRLNFGSQNVTVGGDVRVQTATQWIPLYGNIFTDHYKVFDNNGSTYETKTHYANTYDNIAWGRYFTSAMAGRKITKIRYKLQLRVRNDTPSTVTHGIYTAAGLYQSDVYADARIKAETWGHQHSTDANLIQFFNNAQVPSVTLGAFEIKTIDYDNTLDITDCTIIGNSRYTIFVPMNTGIVGIKFYQTYRIIEMDFYIE